MNKKGVINISGISESRCAPIIARLADKERQSLIVTATSARADRLASDLSFFFAEADSCAAGRGSGFFAL